MQDLFSNFATASELQKDSVPPAIEDTYAHLQKKLAKAQKKARHAKGRGKKCKKLKRKIKRLEAELETMKRRQHLDYQQRRGRWDELVEKSVPKILDTLTLIVGHKLSRSKGDCNDGSKQR